MPTSKEFDDSRKRLWDEIVLLHDAREQYLLLFGHSPERLEMLNACAAWFFGLVQRALLREQILGISRLTDPAKMGTKTNLVLRSLLSDPALLGKRKLIAELEVAIVAAETAAKPIRAHRHKYIAHLDHAVALDASYTLLPRLSKAQMNDAITKIEAVYNLHGSRIRRSSASFSVGTTRGVSKLIEIIETSERWRLLQDLKRRKEAGEF